MSVGALAAIFCTSFLVSLTGALSPGPLTTLAVREGVRKGFWAGPALAAGHGIVELALVIALALGLDQLLDSDAIAAVIASGVAASLSNPFWFVWWATVGAAYIAEALDEGAIGVATFYSAHILTDLGWLSLIALALASGRRIM